MEKSIYDFDNYKDFINSLIQSKPGGGRGIKTMLAAALSCQTPFISQVLAGDLDFNQDQSLACAFFFGLTKEEIDFFLLLVSLEKAATIELKKFLMNSLQAKRETYKQIKNRMKMKESLSFEHQMTYYSTWLYSAVHMALTIEDLRSRESLAEKFKLSLTRIDKTLEFLITAGLVEKRGSTFHPTGAWYHLDKMSVNINKHHTNLLIKSIQSLDQPKENDLHYSAFFTCSKKDVAKLEELLLKLLTDFNSIVRPSAEEELVAINLNLFRPL
jgi:uncharacterized protein (TIGR02147 family)